MILLCILTHRALYFTDLEHFSFNFHYNWRSLKEKISVSYVGVDWRSCVWDTKTRTLLMLREQVRCLKWVWGLLTSSKCHRDNISDSLVVIRGFWRPFRSVSLTFQEPCWLRIALISYHPLQFLRGVRPHPLKPSFLLLICFVGVGLLQHFKRLRFRFSKLDTEVDVFLSVKVWSLSWSLKWVCKRGNILEKVVYI